MTRLILYSVIFFLNFPPLLFAKKIKYGKAYEYFLNGEYSLLINDYKQAESYLSKAYKIIPTSLTVLQSIVDINVDQKEYDDAIQYLKKIIHLYPENKNSSMDLFQYYFQRKNYDNAQVILDTLLSE